MKMRTLQLVLFLLVGQLCLAQKTADEYLVEAKSKYEAEKYQDALDLYSLGIEQDKKHSKSYRKRRGVFGDGAT